MQDEDKKPTLKNRYEKLKEKREPYITRGQQCAKLTIPALIPEDSHDGSEPFKNSYQSLGTRGVNHLSGKLLLALFPPNSSFFKEEISNKLRKDIPDEEMSKINAVLESREKSILSYLEGSPLRATVSELLKHLIVSGNVLFFFPKKSENMRIYPLSHYVVRRDASGNLLEIITLDKVHPDTLPEEAQAIIKKAREEENDDKSNENLNNKDVELFTQVKLEGKLWQVKQEVAKQIIPSSQGSYRKDLNPYIPLRYTKASNEDYGRGHVEEYIGDLMTVDYYQKLVTEAAAASARILFLLNPNSILSAKELNEAENCSTIIGTENDVSILQLQKGADLAVTIQDKQAIETRLSQAFLLNSSAQRQAERVTAHEISVMVQELEEALGGVYTLFTQDFQLPLYRLATNYLEREKELDALPPKYLSPKIITGLEALGRGNDRIKILNFVQDLSILNGVPEDIREGIDIPKFIASLATANRISDQGFVRDEDTIKQAQQEKEMMKAAQSIAPQLAGQIAQQQPTQ